MRTALLLPVLLLTACGGSSSGPTSSAAVDVESNATSVLREWDERRAAAYASGSVDALRALYVEGSTTGDADAAVLQQYDDRGLVVTGMRTQVLSLAVLAEGADELTLLVTDRLVGAVAHGAAGDTTLPRDQASTHQVVLRRVAGQWLVDSVE